jgi:hypothetical protein
MALAVPHCKSYGVACVPTSFVTNVRLRTFTAPLTQANFTRPTTSASGSSITTFFSVPAKPDRHGWNSLENYFHIHESRMRDFLEDGFVIEDGLKTEALQDTLILTGRIRCQHGLFVDVYKVLAVEQRHGRPWVRTEACKYHAGVEGPEARPVFRYDTSHSYPDHPDTYHKHRFDHATWTEIGSPQWIGRDDWPHLSDAIEELRSWWYETGQYLGLSQAE